VINDYHALCSGLSVQQMPDNIVHDLGAQVELKALEAGLKVQELAMFYESVYRQRPKVHGVTLTDTLKVKDQIG
jgi:hypothetical protein